ncbi:hypothetical protein V1525DRAFT_355334 [Lipomyces kononenkoae]|uniref:Uncharacterized protein n=1 Tax=Lipomyces kononenkoae TaxID=34357 RepID=A0ACC3T7S5_LIPKO
MNYLRDLLYNSGTFRERKKSSDTSQPANSQTIPAKPQNEPATARQELLALLAANKEAYCSKGAENHGDASDGLDPSASVQDAQLDEETSSIEADDIQSPSTGRMGNSNPAYVPQVPLEGEQLAPGTPSPRTPSPRMGRSPGGGTQQDSDTTGMELATPPPKPRKKDHESPVLKEAVNMLSEQLSPPGNKITDRWQLMSEYRNLDARLMRLEAMEAVMRIQIRAMAPSGVDVIQEEDDDSAWEDEEDDSADNQTTCDSQQYLDCSASSLIADNVEEGNTAKAVEQEAGYDNSSQSIDETTIMMSTLLPLGMAPLDSLSSGCTFLYGYGNDGTSVAPEQHCQYPTELDTSADFLRSTLKPGFCDPFDDENNTLDIMDDQKLPSQCLNSQPANWPVNTSEEFNDRSEQENRKTTGNKKESSHRQHRRPQRSVLSISPFHFLDNDIDYLMKDKGPASSPDCDSTAIGQAQSRANKSSEAVEEVPRDVIGALDTTADEASFPPAQNGRLQSSHVVQQNDIQWMAARRGASPTHRCRSAPTISPESTPQKSSCKNPRTASRRKGLHVRFNEFAEVRVISDTDERFSLYEDSGWTW